MALSRTRRERVGKVEAFPVNAVPTGWYECVGGTKLIAGDPALFNFLGTTYGGDGVTTFGLPDYQGVHHRGLDRSGAIDPGRTVGDYQADDIKTHNHRYSVEDLDGPNTTYPTGHAGRNTGNAYVDNTGIAENRVKNRSVVYGIKR